MLCETWHTETSNQALGTHSGVYVIVSVKMARMKTIFSRSWHVWKLYYDVLPKEHKEKQAYCRKAREGEF